MGFVMDGLDKEDYDREYGDRVLLARIAGYFRPHARTMAAVGALVTATSLLETAIPIVVARGLDALIATRSLPVLLGLAALGGRGRPRPRTPGGGRGPEPVLSGRWTQDLQPVHDGRSSAILGSGGHSRHL